MACEQELSRDRADERHQHVPLGVPHVALCSEERIGLRAADLGSSPLDELVARADRETHARHEEEQPLPALERRSTEQHLARDDRWNEPLRQMSDSVVVIA
jgi:hypothetical protein